MTSEVHVIDQRVNLVDDGKFEFCFETVSQWQSLLDKQKNQRALGLSKSVNVSYIFLQQNPSGGPTCTEASIDECCQPCQPPGHPAKSTPEGSFLSTAA